MASTLFSLVGTEMVLRVIKPVPLTGWQVQPCISTPDTEIGYRYLPNRKARIQRFFEMEAMVETNSDGFHDADWGDAAANSLKVLAVGDSFAAAIHVPIESSWSRVAEREANRFTGSQLRIYNAGIGGTGTYAHVRLAEELVARLKPDIVLFDVLFQ